MKKYDKIKMLMKLKKEAKHNRMLGWHEINDNNNLPHASTYTRHFKSLEIVARYLKLEYNRHKKSKIKPCYTSGKKIRKLRRMCGLTQKELSKLINVSKSAISAWEREICNPQYNNLIKLTLFFECDNDFLIKDCYSFYEYRKKCFEKGDKSNVKN